MRGQKQLRSGCSRCRVGKLRRKRSPGAPEPSSSTTLREEEEGTQRGEGATVNSAPPGTYLKSRRRSGQALTSSEGSGASRLAQARADREVMEPPACTTTRDALVSLPFWGEKPAKRG